MLKHRAQTILGDLPSNWEAKPLRSLLSVELGGDWGDEQGEQPLKVIRSTNFTDTGYLDFSDVERRFFTLEKAVKLQPFKGDILVERSGGGPTQPVGRVGIIECDLPEHGFSNFVQLLRPDPQEIEPDFLAWSLFRLHQSGIVERLQHQTTQMRNLDYRDYVRVLMPTPPRPEQEAIAKAIRLVSEAGQLVCDKLKAAQRLKTALMQQLFTRGIPGRHTDWKPLRVFRHNCEIPACWETARLASCVSLIDYGTNDPSNPDKAGLPVVAIPQVVSARFELKDCGYAILSADEATALRLAPNDVLLIRTNGNAEYIGKSTVIGKEAHDEHIVFASYLIRIRTKPDRLLGRYLNYFLHSPLGRRQSQAMANTSAGNHNLGARSLRQFWIPRPDKEEQTEIVETLATVEDMLDSLENELDRAKRLKTSLLQNLLTGKVRIKMED